MIAEVAPDLGHTSGKFGSKMTGANLRLSRVADPINDLAAIVRRRMGHGPKWPAFEGLRDTPDGPQG